MRPEINSRVLQKYGGELGFRSLPKEVWFQDEARTGQKNKITRPSRQNASHSPAGQQMGEAWYSPPRTSRSACEMGLYIRRVMPGQGKGAGLVMP
ncbi:MAG: hypothetical protein ACPGGK_04990 [Pikeienuella sp.]